MSKKDTIQEYSWIGSGKNFVDEINLLKVGPIVAGQFEGNSSAGQDKNEDGCLVWTSEQMDFELAVLLDAHKTSESAELVLSFLFQRKKEIQEILTLPLRKAFDTLTDFLLTLFESESFKKACKKVEGETAFLCTFRKGKYLWWFSIGDCILHLYHSELSSLNEYQQNHRSFYEWIGRVHTFDSEVPCYSTGRKELRKGKNLIFMTTDGLTECPNTNFDEPKEIFRLFEFHSIEQSVEKLLKEIQNQNVRDSTTILSWEVVVQIPASQPSG